MNYASELKATVVVSANLKGKRDMQYSTSLGTSLHQHQSNMPTLCPGPEKGTALRRRLRLGEYTRRTSSRAPHVDSRV
jgi:hypothetical protein